jgi:site-specific recombinase XerD
MLKLGRKTQQNKITSPELIAQIDPQNLSLIKEYIAYLYSVDRSKKTISQYEQDLNMFFVWNLQSNKNKFFVDITKKDYVRYQGYLIGKNGNSPNRVRRLKSVISSLSKYIENILDDTYPNFKNQINKIESPAKQAVRDKTVVDREYVDKLLNSLVEQKQYQKACFLALAAFSGARKSELLRFKVNYFDPSNIVFGALYKTPEKMITKGRGSKGKALTRFTLVKDFEPYFNLWMSERKEMGIESEWLFVTRKQDSWIQTKTSTVDKWAEKLSESTGIPIYWHAFRHFFTTELKRHNIPDSVIQNIIGWESSAMILVYTDLTIDDEIGKYFDEGGIKQNIKSGTLNELK